MKSERKFRGWCKRNNCNATLETCPLYWYRKAASQGSEIAKIYESDVYAIGVERRHPLDVGHESIHIHQDIKKALRLLGEFTHCQDVRLKGIALCRIGDILKRKGDVKRALSFYEASEAIGNVSAMYNINELEETERIYGHDMTIERLKTRIQKMNENKNLIKYRAEDIAKLIERSESECRFSQKKKIKCIYVGMPLLEALVLARYYHPGASMMVTDDNKISFNAETGRKPSNWAFTFKEWGGDLVLEDINMHPAFLARFLPDEYSYNDNPDVRLNANEYFSLCLDSRLSNLKRENEWKKRYEEKLLRLKGEVVEVDEGKLSLEGIKDITNTTFIASGTAMWNGEGMYENLLNSLNIQLSLAINKEQRQVIERKLNACKGLDSTINANYLYSVSVDDPDERKKLAEIDKGDVVIFEAIPEKAYSERPDGEKMVFRANMREGMIISVNSR